MKGEDMDESNNSFTTPGIHREKAWHLPFQSTPAVYSKGPGDFLGRFGKEDLWVSRYGQGYSLVLGDFGLTSNTGLI